MPRKQVSGWVQWAGVGLTLFSGVAALAALLLPLMLVLLMVLFDSVAHGVVVLLGLLLSWLRGFILGREGGSPLFQTVAFHPLRVAFASLLHALPCLVGLVLILLNRKPGGWWWWIVLSWGIAAAFGGQVVAALLLPGLCIAMLFALPLEALRGR